MYTPKLVLGFAALLSGAAQAQYTLDTTYDASNFFSTWNFFTQADPTHGFVEYVDANTANAEGLAGYVDGAIFMGVDYKTENPANGRKSVRLTSQKSFTHGLFIADIAHMPGAVPGVWPAYWMFGPDWPSSGEIDIIEGINTQTTNIITLHTSPGCIISNEGSAVGTTLKESNCSTDTGCSQTTSNTQNYGDGFNAVGGGVYATEWTSDHIAMWFFPRGSIPQDISSGSPNVSISGSPNVTAWGQPLARFAGGQGCNIDSYFKENNLVFDTTFCGDWAGADDVWAKVDTSLTQGLSCEDFVASKPEAFAESYWTVNSIKVYQQANVSRRSVVPQTFRA